jgi:hypothetical protein
VPVPARGKVYSLGTNLNGSFEDGARVIALDIDRYTYLDAIVFNGVAEFEPRILVPWGTDGLAISGEHGLVIAKGTFAAADSAPPASSSTLPQFSSGVVTTDTNTTVDFKMVDMAARAAITNPCGKLFVTTAMDSWERPGSVMEIDPDTLTITRSAPGGSEPYLLAASDDCSTLYVAPQYSTSVRRIRTSDLMTTDVLPIASISDSATNPGASIALSRARSMSVAPGQAQTVAIAAGDIEYTLCSGSDSGVLIFDGATPRPIYQANTGFGIKSVVFGANPNILFGEDFDDVYAFSVGPDGLTNRRAVMPNPQVTTSYDLGRDLYFDPASSRVYNLFGNVFDSAANAELPRFSPRYTPATLGGCGTPAQARVADRTTGKLFWVSRASQNSLGVSAYARNGIALTGFVEIPLRVVNDYVTGVNTLPGDRLAIVTAAGHLIILHGALFAP